MKILLLITAFFIASFTTANAQISKEVMVFKKSADMRHLSKEEFEQLTPSHFKKSMVADYGENSYLKNGVLIRYLNLKADPPFKKTLEKKLKQNIALHSDYQEGIKIDYKIKTAKIVSFNNIKFSIFEYSYDGDNLIVFTSDYNQNNEFFNGLIQYNDADYQKAHVILDELLNSMHFNN